MLTIQILVRNNESTIEKCLKSLPLDEVKLQIGNLGSEDSTLKICKKFTNNIINLIGLEDYSKSRKQLLQISETNWNLIVNPWEVLFSGEEILLDLKNSKEHIRTSVVQGDVLFEEIRLINKKIEHKITNPAFELIEGLNAFKPIYFSSSGRQDLDFVLRILEKWNRSNLLSAKPIYYLACTQLSLKNWDNFLNYGKLYTTSEKSSNMSKIMTHYYLAMVYLHIKRNNQEALKNIIFCITKKPSMAEFWCLLADIFYAANDYEKAKRFYDAALVLGSQRLNHDDWPVEISRYKEYPEKMISACKNLLASSKIFLPDLDQ